MSSMSLHVMETLSNVINSQQNNKYTTTWLHSRKVELQDGSTYIISYFFNTLRPRRNEQHFADDIFKRIFFNENVCILIKISLKFVLKGQINNIPALVQIMVWRRWGDKPLSEPMVVTQYIHASLGLNELTSESYQQNTPVGPTGNCLI